MLTPDERAVFEDILASNCGLFFEPHRHAILDRAVLRRMEATAEAGAERVRSAEPPTPARYATLLASNPNELALLVDEAVNTLSRFFRNTAQLAAVREVASHHTPAGGAAAAALSVWVAGCSTGEEAYTLAMLLRSALPAPTPLGITATDISRGALATARRAEYAAGRITEIPEQYRRFCVEGARPQAKRFRMDWAVREIVDFREHNVTSGPAVRHVGIVCCRNVLTYLTPPARRDATRALRESLEPGGYLLLGGSETLPRDSGFRAVRVAGVRAYRRE